MKKESDRIDAMNRELSKNLLKNMTHDELKMFLNCSSVEEIQRNAVRLFGPINRIM